MNRTEAFAKYGAKLKNFVWSVAAKNNRGGACAKFMETVFQARAMELLSISTRRPRWKGPGNNEFRLYLDSAFKSGQIIRAVIGRTSDEKAVASGVDAHSLDNTFHVREDWIGEVTVWDGNKFEIEFKSK